MAVGLFSQASIIKNTDHVVYTSAHASVMTIRVLNKSPTQMRCSIAITATTTPTDAEYIEYEAVVDSHEVLLNETLIIPVDKNVVVRTDVDGASVYIYGTVL